MAMRDRNFRSYYYDKVGFRGVEEKKSLEKLLNEKPIDKLKLTTFCLKFTLPSMYREYVWKIILGVISVNPECHEKMMIQRNAHFADLHRAVEVTRLIDTETPEPVVYVMMFLVAEGSVLFDLQKQMEDPNYKNLVAIATAFTGVGSSQMGKFWLFKSFMSFQKKFPPFFKSLEEQLKSFLKKRDPELYSHLVNIKVIQLLPIETWFSRYFAEILHVDALKRIWDRIIGGSCKICPFVGVELLIALRQELLSLKTKQQIVEFLDKKIPEEKCDIAVVKALDLCHCTT